MELENRLIEDAEQADIHTRHHAMTAYIQQEAKIFRNIFINDLSDDMQKMFFDNCHRDFLTIIGELEEQGRHFDDPPELMAAFYAGGISSMLTWWILHDFPVTADELMRCQDNMVSSLGPMGE
jgi:hypothetical protein